MCICVCVCVCVEFAGFEKIKNNLRFVIFDNIEITINFYSIQVGGRNSKVNSCHFLLSILLQ